MLCNNAPVETAAVKQLQAVANLPGVVYAVGLPDLHAGNRFPIGSTVVTTDLIYPGLIGESKVRSLLKKA